MQTSATASPHRPTLSPQIAVLTVNLMIERGVDKHDLFRRLPFDEEKLHTEGNYLSILEMYALAEAAMDLSECPWLGLEVGQAQTVSSWGVLGYAIMSCASEREAVALGVQYYQAAPSLMRFDTQIVGDRLRLKMEQVHPNKGLLPFCVEENLTGMSAASASYLQTPMAPLEVWVSYARPSYADMYDEILNCPVKFDQVETVLWTRAPTDAPLRTSDPVSAQLCLKLVEQVLERNQSASSFEQEVRRLMLSKPGVMPSMEDVAQALGMSLRTLRRRLFDLGTSFRKLQDEVRRDLTLDYLKNTPLNIDQIAHLVGYTETTNFRRAFKQWTGHPPSHYRG